MRPEVGEAAAESVRAYELVCLGFHGFDMSAITELVLAAIIGVDYVGLPVVPDAGHSPEL